MLRQSIRQSIRISLSPNTSTNTNPNPISTATVTATAGACSVELEILQHPLPESGTDEGIVAFWTTGEVGMGAVYELTTDGRC
jgi:hypothetical protein